jgi:hypothetical protein
MQAFACELLRALRKFGITYGGQEPNDRNHDHDFKESEARVPRDIGLHSGSVLSDQLREQRSRRIMIKLVAFLISLGTV